MVWWYSCAVHPGNSRWRGSQRLAAAVFGILPDTPPLDTQPRGPQGALGQGGGLGSGLDAEEEVDLGELGEDVHFRIEQAEDAGAVVEGHK